MNMKNTKKIITIIVAFTLILSSVIPDGCKIFGAKADAKSKFILNKTKVSLHVGESFKLKVKNIKEMKKYKIKWSSGKKRVASVNGKGKITAKAEGNTKIKCKIKSEGIVIKILKCKVTVKATESKTTTVPTVKPSLTVSLKPSLAPQSTPATSPEDKKSRTIMFFADGVDLESKYGFLSENLKEIMSSKYSENLNIIMMTGGTQKYHISDEYVQDKDGNPIQIDVNEKQLWRVTGKENESHGKMTLLENVDELKNESYVSSKPLTYLIDYSLKNYPADMYDLILWDHGNGIFGFGEDQVTEVEGADRVMSADTFVKAIEDSNMEQKFEMIDFECCLMGNVEFLTLVSDYANNYVVSAETEPASGQVYKGFLEMLNDNIMTDGFTLGKKIVDDYQAFYNDKDNEDYGSRVTLSAINAQEFEKNMVPILTEFTDVLRSEALEKGENNIYNFYDELNSAQMALHYKGYGEIDFGGFLNALGIILTETDNTTNKSDYKLGNLYTDISLKLNDYLNNDEIFYTKNADSMNEKVKLSCGRNKDGEVVTFDNITSSGLSVFFPFNDNTSAPEYVSIMNTVIETLKKSDDKEAKEKIHIYENFRDIAGSYYLIMKSGKAISELSEEGKENITLDTVKEKMQLYSEYDYDKEWFDGIFKQQKSEIIQKDNIENELLKPEDEDKYSYKIGVPSSTYKTLNYTNPMETELTIIANDKDDKPIFPEGKDIGAYVPKKTDFLSVLDVFDGGLFNGEEDENASNIIEGRSALYDKDSVNLKAPKIEPVFYQITDTKGKSHLVTMQHEASDPSIGYIPLVFATSLSTDDGYTFFDQINLRMNVIIKASGEVEVKNVKFLSMIDGPVDYDSATYGDDNELYTAYGTNHYLQMVKLNRDEAVSYDLSKPDFGLYVETGKDIKSMDNVTGKMYDTLNQRLVLNDIYGVKHFVILD